MPISCRIFSGGVARLFLVSIGSDHDRILFTKQVLSIAVDFDEGGDVWASADLDEDFCKITA